MEGTEVRAVSAEPTQKWATDGIAPLKREKRLTRLLMKVVERAEHMNRRFSTLGSPCVYDNAAFPWATDLERSWRTIRAELDQLLKRRRELPNVQDITTDAASITRDSGWRVFLFTAYGVASRASQELCPQTWSIVSRIPGIQTAMFSILEPGKRLPPHRGPYNGVIRVHLGLLVPQPQDRVGIRIGDEARHWEEGRVLIFDDAYEHEAWNETSSPRVVLFLDVAKPLRFPANAINGFLLRIARITPFLREGEANLRRWERGFYKEGRELST